MLVYRCKRLFKRSQDLDPARLFYIISINGQIFRDLFWTKRKLLMERPKAFKAINTRPAGRAGAKGAQKPPATTTPAQAAESDTKTIIVVSRGLHRVIVSPYEKLDGGGKRAMPEIVVHEDEVTIINEAAVSAEIKGGVPEAVIQKKDRFMLVAEFLLRKMVLVKRPVRSRGSGGSGEAWTSPEGEKVVAIPALTRWGRCGRLVSVL